MTRNHNYHTPEKGSKDWHIPLNDNFEQLDTAVEIRDVESNLDDYKPKAGAKFLATDTEKAFIGDGDTWNEIRSSGPSPSFDSVESVKVNNVQFARPGEVQSVIDSAANASEGRVRVKLEPQVDYDPSSTINVKHGVDLDFNGAKMVLSSDIDVIHIEPGGQVFDPHVDVSDVTYTSNVYKLDAVQYGKYDHGLNNGTDAFNTARLTGGHTQGTFDEGTAIKLFADSSRREDGHIYFARFENHQIREIGTGIELESKGSNFINSNYFHGVSVSRPNKAVHFHGDGYIQDIRLTDFLVQPYFDKTSYGFHLEAGSHTHFNGIIWDKTKFPTASQVIELTPDAEHSNTFIDNFKLKPKHFTDNSGEVYNSWRSVDMDVFDSSHGYRWYNNNGIPKKVLWQNGDDTWLENIEGGGELRLFDDGRGKFSGEDYFQFTTAMRLESQSSEPPTNHEGVIALADSDWDPDDDGDGELVIYDGTEWVEIANLPNV